MTKRSDIFKFPTKIKDKAKTLSFEDYKRGWSDAIDACDGEVVVSKSAIGGVVFDVCRKYSPVNLDEVNDLVEAIAQAIEAGEIIK